MKLIGNRYLVSSKSRWLMTYTFKKSHNLVDFGILQRLSKYYFERKDHDILKRDTLKINIQ